MDSAAEFREEADRYRKMAAAESNPALRDQLLAYARQYESLAAMMEEVPAPPLSSVPQQQRVQQPQAKLQTDESTEC